MASGLFGITQERLHRCAGQSDRAPDPPRTRTFGNHLSELSGGFGDKDGLLAALAVHGFELYLNEKHELLQRSDDPVEDLYRGWDLNVDFGIRHPGFYVLMYSTAGPGHRPPVADEAHDLLVKVLGRVAEHGRLSVPADIAAGIVHAATTGAALTLIGMPEPEEHLALSQRLRDTVLGSLLVDHYTAHDSGLASRALALESCLRERSDRKLPFTAAETALLQERLHRLAR